MSVSRRGFIKQLGQGLARASLAAENLVGSTSVTKEGSERLLLNNPQQPKPAPKDYDRLPLGGYQQTVRRLKQRVAEKGVDAILLGSDTNRSILPAASAAVDRISRGTSLLSSPWGITP